MASQKKTGDETSTKRPSQTLDLEAREVHSSDDQPDQAEGADTSEPVDETLADSEPGPSRGGAFLSYVAAGLIGAVLALVGQPFMPRLVGEYNEGPKVVESLKGQLAALEEKLDQTNVEDVKAALAALEKKVDERSKNTVEPRLQKMETILADLAKGARTGQEGIEGLAALATKMNSIETDIDQKLEVMKSQLVGQLREDVTKRSKFVATQESLVQIEGVKLSAEELGKRVALIEARSAKFTTKLAELRQLIHASKADLVSKDDLLREVKTLQSQMTGFRGNLDQLKTIEREAHETARRSALALALTNLKRSMGRGDGFQGELQAVKRLMGPQANLAGDFEILSQFAGEGLSRDKDLLGSFPELARTAIAADSVKQDASIWDKVTSKARHTFRYRRTGDVEGQSTEAILARMEHKFKDGHLEEVVLLSKVLGPKPGRVLAPWVTKLQARLAVEKAIFKIEDQLQASLRPRVE